MRPDIEKLISKQSALDLLFARWFPEAGIETVPLTEAAGRILAQDQFARYDLPVVRASTMDGVAVKSERFLEGMPDTSDWKMGVDFVRADTGDDFDDAFDTVIAIENVELLPGGGIRFPKPVNARRGFNVKGKGTDLQAGALLAPKGTRLTAQALGAIAMGGNAEVPVFRKPRVAFLPTGNELVPPGAVLNRGQNFDTNSLMVSNMLQEMGAEPLLHPILRDDPDALREALTRVLPDSDIVLMNAGTSKGSEDYCCHLLEEAGEVLFQGVAAVPGRPMSMAFIQGKPVVNLSGPSFAAFYSVDWAVRAMICRFLGVPVPVRETVEATLTETLQTPPFFALMAAFRVEVGRDGGYLATPLSLRGPKAAGSAAALLADGVYITTPGEPPLKAGSTITIELLKNRAELSRAQ